MFTEQNGCNFGPAFVRVDVLRVDICELTLSVFFEFFVTCLGFLPLPFSIFVLFSAPSGVLFFFLLESLWFL